MNLVPAFRSIKSPFTLPESSHEQWWSLCFENSFGWRLQYLTSKHTCPTAQVSTEKPLQEELASSGWSSWDESALGPCLRYVWGSSLKAVPQEWKAYDNEAKLNFPLGEYRGFTYLWASVVKHIQTLRMFFYQFLQLLQFFTFFAKFETAKTPDETAKTPDETAKKKMSFFWPSGLAWDGFLGPVQFEQINDALCEGLPTQPVLWSDVIFEEESPVATCVVRDCQLAHNKLLGPGLWKHQFLIYGIPSLAVSRIHCFR